MNLLNVSFLAPLALIGLAALAVPIYLHMRHKPRAESFRFPAIDFLLKAQKKKKRRFHAEQLMLMLFRIGIICLLAFLFARPYIDNRSTGGGGDTGRPLIVLLDDSISMMASDEDGSRFFENAVDQLGEVLRARSSGVMTRILPASAPKSLLRLETARQIRDYLDQIKATTYAVTLDAAYAEALNLIEAEGLEGATIRIYTDGSRTAWRELPATKPEKADVIYHSMRPEEDFENVAISSVTQAPGDANSIEVALMNSNPDPAELSLAVNGGRGALLRQQIRVVEGGRASHYFGLGEPVPPTLDISIPSDNFDLDNQVVYAPRANRSVHVLVVDGDTHPDTMRNESFFLRNAFGADEAERYGYKLDVVTPSGLTRSLVDQADVIFMLNVEVPVDLLLDDALKKGKGLFVGMGERMDFERWNKFLGNYDLEMWETARLPNPAPVDLKDFDHPMFYPIEEYEWRTYLRDVAIEQVRVLSLGRAGYDVPLALPNGSPVLLARDLRPGRLMVWTSSMDIDWNNFPLEFGFVPFVRQTANWLASRDSSNSYQTLTTNQVLEQGLVDQLNLKHVNAPFRGLDVAGPKPGIYTRQIRNRNQFVQVVMDESELDFRGFATTDETQAGDNPLEELGFRSYLRSDLAPSVQIWLFLAVLVETLIAARVTDKWGSR
ncbi:MAG: BatA domain-containing protein [Acidobacteriota bacterium]|nr:BatA domain-containing protein [Acidobacteriota bacterium]